MPVQKFRTLDEARRALWMRSDDPRLPDRALRLMAFSRRLAIVHAPPGVRRFRTMEEANAERKTWRVETLMKPMGGEPGAGG
jgi:hypothetical protein